MEALSAASFWQALGGDARWPERLRSVGNGDLASPFRVTDLAVGSVGAAALSVAEFVDLSGNDVSDVTVDRRLASLWFGSSIRPVGWEMPGAWDAVAGDYEAADGWIRLHTNAPHHRKAALRVLDVEGQREAVADAVRHWHADTLEQAVVAAGGCAAAMRSPEAWQQHPQGAAVAAEPLVAVSPGSPVDTALLSRSPNPTRPLAGIRVLDLTRVLAGPVATRFLAGYGADVLRIDPPDWDEPGVVPDVTLGKRCARLDLKAPAGRDRLLDLLGEADILVHGYRPGALDRLGLDAEARARHRPGLVDVSLSAYGHTGSWAGRRGFDSLVQMSSGIAHEGQARAGADRPVPLPVQALDHATGYLMAAAALRGLSERSRNGHGSRWQVSLARTAHELMAAPRLTEPAAMAGAQDADYTDQPEETVWGRALRLRPPADISGCPMRWDRPASDLGSASPAWA